VYDSSGATRVIFFEQTRKDGCVLSSQQKIIFEEAKLPQQAFLQL
jgi:hypothetical protein